MTTRQRIRGILAALLMIAMSIVMMVDTEIGFAVTAAILSLSLSIYGLRYLLYYFTMARHMVGGKLLLYVSIIILDLGLFTASMATTPRFYIILYLIGVHAFSGAVEILRGREARSYGDSSWKLSIAHGAVNILVALTCVVFLRSTEILVYIYCAGLIYSAFGRIAASFRKSSIVYIQ